MKSVQAYGIVPLKKEDGRWKVFLVKHKAGHWGFPKGHPEIGESPQETAVRELKEETGLFVDHFLKLEPLISRYHCISHGEEVDKTVTYFAAAVYGEIALDSIEIEEGLWVELEKAGENFGFSQMKLFMQQLKAILRSYSE